MAQEAQTQSQPAAPAQVAPPTATSGMAPQVEALTSAAMAANPDTVAEVRAALAAHSERISRETPAQDTAVAAPAATGEAQPAAQAPTPQAADPTQPAPAAEPEKPQDTVASSVGLYLRQKRAAEQAEKRAKAEAESARAAKASAEAEAAKATAAEKAAAELAELAKTDPVAAIRKLVGDERLNGSTAIVDLVNALAGQETKPELTEEQRVAAIAAKVEADIRAKLKAEQEEAEAKRVAEAKAAEDAREQRNMAAKEAFFIGLDAELKASYDKYPLLEAKQGFSTKAAEEWIEERFKATGKPPLPHEIFTHFEQEYERDADAFIAARQKRMGAQPAPSVQPAQAQRSPAAAIAPATTQADSRGRVVNHNEPTDYLQRREEMLRRL